MQICNLNISSSTNIINLTHKVAKYQIIIILIVLYSLSSCISQRKIKYAQNISKTDSSVVFGTAAVLPNVIMPFDELFIRVSSPDEKTAAFLNPIGQSAVSTQLPELISYTVSDNGELDYPFVGKIKVSGLTIDEATDTLKQCLLTYLTDLTVTIKFMNKTFSVLGEIKNPGRYSFPKQQINIYEAVAMAGDITDFGNRSKVTIIRQLGDSTVFYYLDVRKKNVVENEFYYLRPDDVVYIEPLRAKFWGAKTSAPEAVTTYMTYLTTLISLYLIIKNL